MTRRGITLVELLLAALIGTVVLGGAWFLFLSGSRQSVRLDEQIGRVQSLVLLLENLSDDVASAVQIPGGEEPGSSLKIYRLRSYDLAAAEAEREGPGSGAVRAEAVVYRFEGGRVTRNGRQLPLERLSSVRFKPPGPLVPGLGVEVSFGTTGTFDFLLPFEPPALEAAFEDWQENYYDMTPVAFE